MRGAGLVHGGKGSYKSTEKIFLVASLVYISYIFAGVLSQPSWHDALWATVRLPQKSVWSDKAYMYMAIGIVGTTIAPVDAVLPAIVDRGKGHSREGLRGLAAGRNRRQLLHRYCGLVHHRGLRGHALRARHGRHPGGQRRGRGDAPAGWRLCLYPFAFGLFNASIFSASILPISTAYTVCEGLGVESGVDKSFKEAPFFYWLYTLLIVGGAATVLLLPDAQLINVAILSQVLNGVLLRWSSF